MKYLKPAPGNTGLPTTVAGTAGLIKFHKEPAKFIQAKKEKSRFSQLAHSSKLQLLLSPFCPPLSSSWIVALILFGYLRVSNIMGISTAIVRSLLDELII
jgi:hypothetical protein